MLPVFLRTHTLVTPPEVLGPPFSCHNDIHWPFAYDRWADLCDSGVIRCTFMVYDHANP